ncbi:MAG: GTP diphosphokinase [Rickettsiella sp.]|nr:GTP diphosphokinase [Rickettsiella sp.]
MVKIKNSLYLNDDGSINLEAWLHHAAIQRNQKDFKLIRQACILSQIVGETKLTPTRISCLQQGLTMAEILFDLHLDTETIASALIYSAVNYAELCPETINEHLGPQVTKLIEGATQMDAIRISSTSILYQAQLENLRKMLLAMVKDMRVVLIKLAERVTTMRTLDNLEEETRRSFARETLDIYAPLANRLGVGQLQWELEDLSLHYLEPEIYTKIAQLLHERLIDRETYVQTLIAELRTVLEKAHLQNFQLHGRVKHIHSIYRKMQQKKLKFEQLYDLNAIRILVNTVKDCYSALSIIHGLWEPIPGQFDDYVATPKSNGYRSIHTAVLGPDEKTLEIQIRTHQMHQESEHGLAAHWQYKENAQQNANYQTKIAWLRQVLEWQKELVKSGKATVPGLTTVLDDRIYVFTPNGDIIDLPKGATPLDFAYHIHSEVGHRCRGAKVNGTIVPLIYQLKIGEQVEILTAKQGTPSRDWLNPNLGYLYTARAKAKAHHWFKNQDYDKHVAEGQTLLDKEYQRLGLMPIDQEKLAHKLHFKTKKELLAALGSGDIRITQLLNAMQTQEHPQDASMLIEREILLGKPRSTLPEGISIEGVTNLLTQTAGCCKPVPGDPIRGFITQGRGIVLHRDDCTHLLNLETDKQTRLVNASWGKEASQVYPVDVCVEAYDRPGLVRDVSTLIANEKLNLIGLTLSSNKIEPKAFIKLTIEIPSITSLSKILDRIKQIPNVVDVRRHLVN